MPGRQRLRAAFDSCAAYEAELGRALLAGLARFNSIRLYGPGDMTDRVPTFAFNTTANPASSFFRINSAYSADVAGAAGSLLVCFVFIG